MRLLFQIKEKFRIKDEEKNNKLFFPYKPTIEAINKIEYEFNPREKFETLMKANLELKTTILDVTSGKCELDSMDDVLPLSIYVATQISLKNVVAEVNMIEDYFRFSKDCIDKESRVLTNLKVTFFLFIFNF